MSAPAILASLLDFRRLDEAATVRSGLHAIDARAKVLFTLVFIVCVMSFGRYEVAGLLPYFAWPVLACAAARVPLRLVARQALVVLPVALLIGMANPFFDREPLLHAGSVAISGGWVSMVSIVLRALLAALASLVLVAITGFTAICGALERLGMPKALAVQLLFLYRYLGVLGEEAQRMNTAYELRSNGGTLSIGHFGSLAGRLLMRTWDRAERIYLAMCARGFNGEFTTGRGQRLWARDWAFLFAASAACILLRTHGIVDRIGALAVGAQP